MNFFHVSISPQAKSNVLDVLESGFLNEGKWVRLFEKELSNFIGRPVLAVSSCTAALHLALLAENIGPGDEVILPSQTFVATATVILQCGATPVFADIDPETGNINPKSIETKITSKTKAIMPVHFGGFPCEMDEIKEYNLKIIEDAAHALGTVYKSKVVGTLSDYACFSFQAIKLITSGDGGAITFPEDKADDIRIRKWFGIDKDRVKSDYDERLPNMDRLGFKYNMNNVAAALGAGNFWGLGEVLEKRRRVAGIYFKELSNLNGLKLMRVAEQSNPSYWLFPVLVEKKRDFFNKMKDKKIPVKMVNWGVDLEPIFHQNPDNLKGQRYFDEHHLCLPVHEALTDDEIYYIVESVKSSLC